MGHGRLLAVPVAAHGIISKSKIWKSGLKKKGAQQHSVVNGSKTFSIIHPLRAPSCRATGRCLPSLLRRRAPLLVLLFVFTRIDFRALSLSPSSSSPLDLFSSKLVFVCTAPLYGSYFGGEKEKKKRSDPAPSARGGGGIEQEKRKGERSRGPLIIFQEPCVSTLLLLFFFFSLLKEERRQS